MKIGFLVHRNEYYKYFAPVIDEALRRGHQVVCLHDCAQPRTGRKGYQFPDIAAAPAFRFGNPDRIPFGKDDDLVQIAAGKGLNAIVSLTFTPQDDALYRVLKDRGVSWVALHYFLDGYDHLLHGLNGPDRHFFYSPIWLDWAVEYVSSLGSKNGKTPDTGKLRQTSRSAGCVELDQMGLINPAGVREEWDIPPDKPVVLLVPFPVSTSRYNFWSRFVYGADKPVFQSLAVSAALKFGYLKDVWGRWNDPNVLRAVRRFCDNNEAYLLVKARLKEGVEKHVAAAADRIVYDESCYPATILKCLSISSLCIHFVSSTVTEAVSAGVPVLFISSRGAEMFNLESHFPALRRQMLFRYVDHPGISHRLTVPEAIRSLPHKSLADFPLDPVQRSEYIEKFLGFSDGRSSSRVLDEMERLPG